MGYSISGDDLRQCYGDLHRQPFTLAQAAEYLGIDEDLLYRLARAGRIAATGQTDNLVFALGDLEDFKAHLAGAVN